MLPSCARRALATSALLVASLAIGSCGALARGGAPTAAGVAESSGPLGALAAWLSRAGVAPEPRSRRAWDHVAAAHPDGDACRAALRRAGVRFRPLPDRPGPDARGCGIPHGVVVWRGATGLAYDPPLRVDCGFALELARAERIVQEEARAHLGAPVRRIRTYGTYACRGMRGRPDWLSEHALGNAVDVARFEPRRGRAADVLRDYEPRAAVPSTPRGVFLRRVQARLRAETALSHVIGPDRGDRVHDNHFHIDRGIPWGWF